jgi:hypothetical protein
MPKAIREKMGVARIFQYDHGATASMSYFSDDAIIYSSHNISRPKGSGILHLLQSACLSGVHTQWALGTWLHAWRTSKLGKGQ